MFPLGALSASYYHHFISSVPFSILLFTHLHWVKNSGGKNGWETMKCVKICVWEKEPFWGDQQGMIPREHSAVILGHRNIAQGK